MRLSSVSVLQLRVQTRSFSSSIIPYVDVVFTMSAAAKASETAQRTKEFPRHEAKFHSGKTGFGAASLRQDLEHH